MALEQAPKEQVGRTKGILEQEKMKQDGERFELKMLTGQVRVEISTTHNGTDEDAYVKCGLNASLEQSKVQFAIDGDTEVASVIIVQLRPEGIDVPFTLDEETADETGNDSPSVSFKEEVILREYVKGSVPTALSVKKPTVLIALLVNPHQQERAPALTVRPILRLRTTDNSSNDTNHLQFVHECIASLDDCEDELKILERSLPSQSSDPQSIGYTRKTIAVTRHAIVEARFCEGRDEDHVCATCDQTKQARDFHEETLRRVNGPTHFEIFKHAVAVRRQSDLNAWQHNAGTASEEFFDNVQGDEDDEDSDESGRFVQSDDVIGYGPFPRASQAMKVSPSFQPLLNMNICDIFTRKTLRTF